MEVTSSQHAPGTLLRPHGKEPSNYFVRSWVGPRASLEDLEKRKSLTSARMQTLACLACSLVSIQTILCQLPEHRKANN